MFLKLLIEFNDMNPNKKPDKRFANKKPSKARYKQLYQLVKKQIF